MPSISTEAVRPLQGGGAGHAQEWVLLAQHRHALWHAWLQRPVPKVRAKPHWHGGTDEHGHRGRTIPSGMQSSVSPPCRCLNMASRRSPVAFWLALMPIHPWGMSQVCCRIWSWSPMPCKKHGPRDSVDKNRGRRLRFLSLLRPEGHVFHTAWETMIKSYHSTLIDWFFPCFIHINMNFSALKWAIFGSLHGC